MSWKLKTNSNNKYVWACDFYTDLQLYNINNLAEYGQPFDPYEPGFNHEFYNKSTNFKEIEIEMPQSQVMNNGYGRKATLDNFPLIKGFLSGEIDLPNGEWNFNQTISKNEKYDYDWSTKAKTNLYYSNVFGGIDGGEISRAEAAYIHGSVWFYLPRETIFLKVSGTKLSASAEIRAIDDKWNFHSDSKIIDKINPLVETLFGPTHNNLEGIHGEQRIKITFTGPGRKDKIEKIITAFPHPSA